MRADVVAIGLLDIKCVVSITGEVGDQVLRELNQETRAEDQHDHDHLAAFPLR